MTSEQLAHHVAQFIQNAQNRVRGIGDQQYSSGDMQRFEAMPLAELLDWADEELQDVAVYAAMLSIRLERIRTAVLGPRAELFDKAPCSCAGDMLGEHIPGVRVMTPPDVWVPVPLRWRWVQPGDVIIGHDGTRPWMVNAWTLTDGQVIAVSAGAEHTKRVDPDAVATVLIPATERDALHLTRAELGARVESRRLNNERGAA